MLWSADSELGTLVVMGQDAILLWGNWNLSCIVKLTNHVQIREITAIRNSFLCPFCLSELMLRCSLFPCLTSVTPASGLWKAVRLQEWAWAHGSVVCRAGHFHPAHISVMFCTTAVSKIRSGFWFLGLYCLWIPDRRVDLYVQEKTVCKVNGSQGKYRENYRQLKRGRQAKLFLFNQGFSPTGESLLSIAEVKLGAISILLESHYLFLMNVWPWMTEEDIAPKLAGYPNFWIVLEEQCLSKHNSYCHGCSLGWFWDAFSGLGPNSAMILEMSQAGLWRAFGFTAVYQCWQMKNHFRLK